MDAPFCTLIHDVGRRNMMYLREITLIAVISVLCLACGCQRQAIPKGKSNMTTDRETLLRNSIRPLAKATAEQRRRVVRAQEGLDEQKSKSVVNADDLHEAGQVLKYEQRILTDLERRLAQEQREVKMQILQENTTSKPSPLHSRM